VVPIVTGKVKIGVVIVAFNNAEMLRSVIESLLLQTRMPDEIIIIDNASSDNTESVVKEFQQLKYVHLNENIGSAGGFHEGIKIASEHNDFVMTLDDDIEMRHDTVEVMEKHIVSLSKQNKLGAVRCWFIGQNEVKDIRKVSDFAWRGTFINKEAIKEVGLPKKEYFLYAEDAEYAYRIKRQGWELFIAPEHLLVDKRKKAKLELSVLGRNRLLYKERFRYYYSFRNQIDMYLTYRMWDRMAKSLLYALKIICLFVVLKKLGSLGFVKAVFAGVCDGFAGKLGKNPKYLPENG
jgi:GT2 family glycosyltransferase